MSRLWFDSITRGAPAQAFADQRRNVTKVHQGRDLYALVCRREAEIVHRVMWDGEGMEVDLPNAKILAGFDLLMRSLRALARLRGSSSLTLKRSLM